MQSIFWRICAKYMLVEDPSRHEVLIYKEVEAHPEQWQVSPRNDSMLQKKFTLEQHERTGKHVCTYNLIEVLLRLRPWRPSRRWALLRWHCAVWWQTSTGWSIAYAHRSRRSSPIRGTGHGDLVPSLLCIAHVSLSTHGRERSRRVAHQGRVVAPRVNSI
jgi:hypothetical protein